MFNCSPLKCSGCDAEFHFPRGSCAYTDVTPSPHMRDWDSVAESNHGVAMHYWNIPLLVPAWCLHCDRASYVERMPSAAEFRSAAGIRKLQDKTARQGFDDDLLYLDDDSFRKLYEFSLNRTATPKCILCGNSSFISIDMNKRDTGLKHEQCWGSPILAGGIIVGGYNGTPDARIRFMNRNGDFLWAKINTDEKLQYWLEAVLHFPAMHLDADKLREAINAILDGKIHIALNILIPLCERGDVSGLSIMGALHYIGCGVEHDGKRARELLTTAMEHGDLAACHNLASLHCTGAPGVERNFLEGWKLFQDAKEIGAQFEPDDFFKMDPGSFYPYYRPQKHRDLLPF